MTSTTRSLNDLWEILKPGIITVPISPETEAILKRVYFIGAASALSLHGSVQADEHRGTKASLEHLESEISDYLNLEE